MLTPSFYGAKHYWNLHAGTTRCLQQLSALVSQIQGLQIDICDFYEQTHQISRGIKKYVKNHIKQRVGSCFIYYKCEFHFYIKCLKVNRKFRLKFLHPKRNLREFTGRLLVFCLQSCLSETFSQDFHVVTKLLVSESAQPTTFVYTYLSPTESWG